jgi:pyruvate/2-oxoglutarate dehydrogenase complex dihydrolipoamide acyltransferase (E2) component
LNGAALIDLVIPEDLWDDDREGVIVTWLYQDGASVERGKVVVELMVEKAQMELSAPASGRLTILAAADAIVHRGQVIGRIG